MDRRIRFLTEQRREALASPEAEIKKPQKPNQPEIQKPREVSLKSPKPEQPLWTGLEAKKEARGFLMHLKYRIKKGEPLEKTLKSISEDIGKDTLERRDTLTGFNELVAKHRTELLELEEEIRKLERSDWPERQKPLEVVDPLRNVRYEKRPDD
ncbi:MAG: hypothetical protein Q7R94_01340 [bacterium]|nr:hypothetical protein [bacterium]